MWQPGDRVFLFGFSRGAYTVRCLAAVLSFCGIPTTMADGKTPLFRDVNSTRKIAKEAVKKVYTYVGSPKDTAYLEQRRALAPRFRKKYGSDINGGPNVNPFFIGVFDTVASLGSYRVGALAVGGFLAALALVSLVQSFFLFAFWPTFVALIAISIIAAGVWYSFEHVQYATGLDGYSFWQTLHLTSWKMQFYDKHLDNAVWYARHALSIDENRADFARVEWGARRIPARRGRTAIPTGSSRSGSPGSIPTSAAATPKTSRDFSSMTDLPPTKCSTSMKSRRTGRTTWQRMRTSGGLMQNRLGLDASQRLCPFQLSSEPSRLAGIVLRATWVRP